MGTLLWGLVKDFGALSRGFNVIKPLTLVGIIVDLLAQSGNTLTLSVY